MMSDKHFEAFFYLYREIAKKQCLIRYASGKIRVRRDIEIMASSIHVLSFTFSKSIGVNTGTALGILKRLAKNGLIEQRKPAYKGACYSFLPKSDQAIMIIKDVIQEHLDNGHILDKQENT